MHRIWLNTHSRKDSRLNKKLFDRLTSTFNYDKTTGILYGTHHGYLTSIDAKEITVIETSSSDDDHCIIIRSGFITVQ